MSAAERVPAGAAGGSGRRAQRLRRQERFPVRLVLVSALFLDALSVVGAVAVWPIYRSTSFVVMAVVALIVANGIAFAGLRWRWSGWWVAAAALGAYVAGGLPLAAPTTLGGEPLKGLLGVLTAPVTGWKDLLTLELPLGDYQATLAPAYLLFLALPVLSLSLAWRARRLWVLAAPAALLLTVFGVLFGSEILSGPARVAGRTITGPVELAVGAAALLLSLGYSVWRTLYDRRSALRAAEAASGVRSAGRGGSALTGRIAIGAAMIAIASAVGAVLAPLAVAGEPREVLRAHVDPVVEIAREVSPLVEFRRFASNELYDEVLFRVEASAAVDRVRLATLSFYDGKVARVIDPAAGTADEQAAFLRVPAALAVPTGTEPVEATIDIGAYDRIWTPLVGSLTQITFDGAGGSALADGFFYNADTRMGVQLSDDGLTGAAYTQRGAVETDIPALGSLTATRDAPAMDPAVVPESVTDWIRAQDSPTGGAGLETLIDRLRARGYLSHALTIDEAEPPAWTTALEGYAFEPSRAGHSTDRIDAIFTALLEKQNDVGQGDDAALVAAAGDDEQFAVAAAMIADQLGFPARIVLGARLTDTGGESAASPPCVEGECRGANVSAWIEVQDADGAWVPVDVTPQYRNTMSPELEQRRDPLNPTEVEQQQAESILPAEANPADSGERDDDDTPPGPDLAGLWAALRATGIGLLIALVIAGPFLAILLMKAFRRRSRRGSPDVVGRVVGGWDEYVDAAVDHGRAAPRTATRQELATLYAADDPERRATTLATVADRSVFAETPPSDDESIEFWEIVEAERARFAAERGWWGRVRARLSLRSLTRRRGGVPAARSTEKLGKLRQKDTRPRR